jgi:2-polyprenyl-3-methyl-5-hydroxy-6-metoxy-1,4-benzoquinol methylase
MKKPSKTREKQYQRCLEIRDQKGLTPLGLRGAQVWSENPKQLLFILARYKFVARMFSGFSSVLEIGCGDATGSRLVQQEVCRLRAVDFDEVFIQDARSRMDPDWPMDLAVHDLLEGPVPGSFDGIYALDVLEHIPREKEDSFIRNATASLKEDGVLIFGMPSLESQLYASAPSKAGHVNCKSGADFKALMEKHFSRVFIFSMNDEVVHTGFHAMSHYLFTLCCGRK